MVYNCLTYNNIINLYLLLAITLGNWQSMRMDKIRKIYNIFFNNIPDKMIILGTSYNWVDIMTPNNFNKEHISGFNIIYNHYIINHKYNRKELSNSDKLILLFIYYLNNSEQDSPYFLSKKYFHFFTNSKFIKNEILYDKVYHTTFITKNIKDYMEFYSNELLKYKRLDKILNIKSKIDV